MIYPIVKEIPYQAPQALFAIFAEQDGAVLLESATERPGLGRYSFIAVSPFFIVKDSEKPFDDLAEQLQKYTLKHHPNMPPFQGGAAGYFSYDLCHVLENISADQNDDMQFPALMVGLYDLVIGFDHQQQQAWIFSSGYPLIEESGRSARANTRCQWLLQQLQIIPKDFSAKSLQRFHIESQFSAETYQAAVRQVINYILAGDIFEANLSQRFKTLLPDDIKPFTLYQQLSTINPAPFAAYLHFNDVVLASASPERFLKLSTQQVETRPIKGTRRRSSDRERDRLLAEELQVSEKDRAENIMIVDLMRNDLSRVCRDDSVNVPQLCGLETYASVHHLVSVVTGELQAHMTAIDLLKATFPGGSITGAPKIRAMEIIAELEPTKRGPYCGSIGYIGFNGDMDTSIIIRTFAIKNNIITFQVGGAVVADSDPQMEYEETLTKAKALFLALNACVKAHDFSH